MITLVWIAVAGLFAAKLAWNLAVPYVLGGRTAHAAGPPARGISLAPAVECTLLVLLVGLSFAGGQPGPAASPARVALTGGALIVLSYLHLPVAAMLAGWLRRRRR